MGDAEGAVSHLFRTRPGITHGERRRGVPVSTRRAWLGCRRAGAAPHRGQEHRAHRPCGRELGVREDNLIRVCRKDGSYVRGAKAIRRSAKLAFLEKRMLRVERVGSLMSREAPEQIAQIGCLAAARQVCRGVSCYF
jgi:hypothetical protein